MARVAIFVSGGGTNLQAIIDASKEGLLANANISLVVSSNENAYALKRADEAGIESCVVSRKSFSEGSEFDRALVAVCRSANIDIIVLAGFMCVLGSTFIAEYRDRIINVHPSLIPSFCGEGYYGLRVHEAAIQRGVKVTGATVHIVNEICDGGPILAQKAVEVKTTDTPETIQRRVMEQAEWVLLPRILQEVCSRFDKGEPIY